MSKDKVSFEEVYAVGLYIYEDWSPPPDELPPDDPPLEPDEDLPPPPDELPPDDPPLEPDEDLPPPPDELPPDDPPLELDEDLLLELPPLELLEELLLLLPPPPPLIWEEDPLGANVLITTLSAAAMLI